MNFFTVFIYFFLFFFKCNNYNSFLSKAAEAYNIITTTDSHRAKNYVENTNLVTQDMIKVFHAFFQYKDSFHVIPTIRAMEEQSKDIKALRDDFNSCLNDSGKKNNDQCKRVNNEPIITDLLVENFFFKIFNLEVSTIAIDDTKKMYEEILYNYIKKLSDYVRINISSVLDKMSGQRKQNILNINNGKVLDNYTPLLQKFLKEKKSINEFIVTEEVVKIMLYLNNDYESIKRVILSFFEFIKNNQLLKSESEEENYYNAVLKKINLFFYGGGLVENDHVSSMQEILKIFIKIVNTQKKNIQKDPELLKKFLVVFYSSLLDFDIFDNEKNFIEYFEKCYYSQKFIKIWNDKYKDNSLTHDDYNILNKIFPFFLYNKLIDKQNILSKNFKSLLLIKQKNNGANEEKKLSNIYNLKDDKFFKLFLQNVSDFDFDFDKGRFFSKKEFDLPVVGLTFDSKYIVNNYSDFYNQYVKDFFLSSDSFLLKDIIELSKFSDPSWFTFFKKNQNIKYVSNDNFSDVLIVSENNINLLNRSYQDFFLNYGKAYNSYNNFLTDISLTISVFFLKDFYHPHSRVGYHLKKNRNKLFFLGALFTGIAFFYKNRNAAIPKFILSKAKEVIFPFLSKYTSIFKQKFGSAISLIRRP